MRQVTAARCAGRLPEAAPLLQSTCPGPAQETDAIDPAMMARESAHSMQNLQSVNRWRQQLSDFVVAYRAMDLGALMASGYRESLSAKLPLGRRKKLKTLAEASSIASSSVRSLAFTSNSDCSLLRDDSFQQLIAPVPTSCTSVQSIGSSLPLLLPISPEPDVAEAEDTTTLFKSAAAEFLAHSYSNGSLEAAPRAHKVNSIAKRPQVLRLAEQRPKSGTGPSTQHSTKFPAAGYSSSLIISGGKPLKTERSNDQLIRRQTNLKLQNKRDRGSIACDAHNEMYGSEEDGTRRKMYGSEGRGTAVHNAQLKSLFTGTLSLKTPKDVQDQRSECPSLVNLARKYQMRLEDLRYARNEFNSYDTAQKGKISYEEFQNLVRTHCDLPMGKSVPLHLMSALPSGDLDNDFEGSVSFEDFIFWTIQCAYTEELMVPNAKERRLRELARGMGMRLPDVEKVKVLFDGFDKDGSGEIEEDEFIHILYILMEVKNESDVSEKKMHRFWRELDSDGSGAVGFHEFLIWYSTMFCSLTGIQKGKV